MGDRELTEGRWAAAREPVPVLDLAAHAWGRAKAPRYLAGLRALIEDLLPPPGPPVTAGPWSAGALAAAAAGLVADWEASLTRPAARQPDWYWTDPAAAAARARATAAAGPAPDGDLAAWHRAWQAAWEAARATQAGLMRCVYGNPFRPAAFDPRWRTADVTGLARGIYEDRASDRLPILADALMDAGCDQEDLLAHCRSEGPHVRGCWAVDLVLGLE